MLRRPLVVLCSLALGASTALAVTACGEENTAKIPESQADRLLSALDALRTDVDDGECQRLTERLAALDSRIAGLSPRVDEGLRERLQEGADNLRLRAPRACAQRTDTTTTDTVETVETTEVPTATQAVPTTTTAPPTTTQAPPETTEEPTPEPTETVVIPTEPDDGGTGGSEAPTDDGGAGFGEAP